MSRAVKQPVGQKRLTNIAVVRLKKAGNRFEIACYRNKVNDWRNGIEKDLDEVLQTTNIFANVGKGINAKKEDLMEAFGTTDEEKICLEILAKGEMQVSDKERKAELDILFRDVASVLVDKTVNPETSRPYTLTMLERALKDLHFNPDPKKSAKQQALEVLPLLQQQFPIERAKMRLKLQVPVAAQQQLLETLDAKGSLVETVDCTASTATVITQVEPGVFRELHHFMQDATARQGRIEVLSFAVTGEGAGVDDFAGPAAAAAGVAGSGARPQAREAGATEAEQQQQQQQQRQQPGASTSAPAGVGVAVGGVGAAAARRAAAAGATGAVVYPQGPIAALPEEFASRKERFAELDQLQSGWEVELRKKGDTVDAVFFDPSGKQIGAFAMARRQALAASKQASQQC